MVEKIRAYIVGYGPAHQMIRFAACGTIIATRLLARYRWHLDADTTFLAALGAGAIAVTVLAAYHSIMVAQLAAVSADEHLDA